jgi:hypothetical protein
MAVLPVLSIAAYGASVVGHHPNIDGPESLKKYHGFLRIAAVVLLLLGFVTAIASFDPQSLGIAVVAVIVIGMLATYDYMIVAKKAKQNAKESVAKAGKQYLETKKEINKGPDQVTNVQGDAVAQKTNQTHVDQSRTNVDTIDQSSTHVDQSKTVKDQRTHVEDSVVNRSDIAAGDSAEAGQAPGGANTGQAPNGANQASRRTSEPEPTGAQGGHRTEQTNAGGHQPTERRAPDNTQRSPDSTQQPPAGGGAGNAPNSGGGNTSYCPSCGEEITPGWSNCISCGAELE